jgi:hypothetical protein
MYSETVLAGRRDVHVLQDGSLIAHLLLPAPQSYEQLHLRR